MCYIFFLLTLPLEQQPRVLLPNMVTPPHPHHHPSLGLAQSPGPDPNSPKLKQTNTNNQMNKRTVLTLMLPIQYTTVQYSTVTGEEDGVTQHSTLCGVRGLDLLSVTNVKNVTEEEERREGGDQLGFGVLTRRYGGLWPHTSSSCRGLREALWAP